MTDLTSLTLAQARDALRKKEFSAIELTEAHLAAIEQARALNAFVLEIARPSPGDGARGGCTTDKRRGRPA